MKESQIDKIGRMLGMARDEQEGQEMWKNRVIERIDDTWDRVGELERESTELKRRLRSVQKVMIDSCG